VARFLPGSVAERARAGRVASPFLGYGAAMHAPWHIKWVANLTADPEGAEPGIECPSGIGSMPTQIVGTSDTTPGVPVKMSGMFTPIQFTFPMVHASRLSVRTSVMTRPPS